jgi:hypothetical protein
VIESDVLVEDRILDFLIDIVHLLAHEKFIPFEILVALRK